MLMRGRRTDSGFTVIELVVAIILVAVLVLVVIPKILNPGPDLVTHATVNDAATLTREHQLRMQLGQLRAALASFKNSCGAYPLTLADLTATKPPAEGYDSQSRAVALAPAHWKGPYLRTIPIDPISHARFNYGLRNNRYEVWSSAKGKSSEGTPYSAW